MLEAAAMALVANAPDIVTRERFEAEGRLLPFVVVGGLDALLRVQSVVFADASPPWLANAIEVLTAASISDYVEKARRFSEVFPRWFLAKDTFSEVEKEGDVSEPVEFEFSGEGDDGSDVEDAEKKSGGAGAPSSAIAATTAGPET